MKYTPTYEHFKGMYIYHKTVLILYASMLYSICFAGMLNQTKLTLKIHHRVHIPVWLCSSEFAYNDKHFWSNKQFIKTSTVKIIEFFSITIPKYENLKLLKEKHILVQFIVYG